MNVGLQLTAVCSRPLLPVTATSRNEIESCFFYVTGESSVWMLIVEVTEEFRHAMGIVEKKESVANVSPVKRRFVFTGTVI